MLQGGLGVVWATIGKTIFTLVFIGKIFSRTTIPEKFRDRPSKGQNRPNEMDKLELKF
jgi:hypothetical protein